MATTVIPTVIGGLMGHLRITHLHIIRSASLNAFGSFLLKSGFEKAYKISYKRFGNCIANIKN